MARTRIIVWYALVWSYFLITYPMVLLARYYHNSGKLKQRDALSYYMMIPFSRLTFYMSGSRLKITGKENIPKNKPVVFVSNHQGHMDSLIIHGFIKRPKGFVTITKFQKTPILRSWMKYMGCVFMDKADIRQSLGCINQAVDNVNRGLSMVVFPEGKLNDGKDTLKFEKGWLRLVTKSGVPIIPITLKDSYKALAYNGSGMHPTKIECIISKPIETCGLNKSNENEFMLNLRNTILTKL